MAELKYDFTACIVSGGVELPGRIDSAREEYSRTCGEYFDYLSGKLGKPSFTESACGFVLLDNLLKKNGIDRRNLEIMRNSDGRPCIINRSDVDFSVSHSEGAALVALPPVRTPRWARISSGCAATAGNTWRSSRVRSWTPRNSRGS